MANPPPTVPPTTGLPPTVLSVRVSAEERGLLAEAADQAHTSVSDYMRRRAVEAAEIDMLGRTIVTIPAEAWGDFEAWASAAPKDLPVLRDLLARRLAWQD
jgi:uncharacterized protein (DUF1778 family)